MTSVLEIIRFEVNDRFTSEPNLFSQLRAGAQKGGVKEQVYGRCIEHPGELIWLLRKLVLSQVLIRTGLTIL